MAKKISPTIKIKIIELSKCFWYWKSFYTFYGSVLNVSARELETKYPRGAYNKYEVTEAILDSVSQEKQLEIVRSFYNLERPFNKDKNPNYREAISLLSEFKQAVGTSLLQKEIEKKEIEKRIETQKKQDCIENTRINKLNTIKTEFFKRSKETNTQAKQKRGYWLEKIFFQILTLEKIENHPPYKKNHEQIDGVFRINFDYLVEIKWSGSTVKQKEVSIFNGKLNKKGQSTRGFFLSISGFDESAIAAASTDSPKIIFMDATELISILENRHTFKDLLKDKAHRLAKLGKVYK